MSDTERPRRAFYLPIAARRDGSGSLDDADIAQLLQDKPDTAKLEDHDYDPLDHGVISDEEKAEVVPDKNFKPKKKPKEKKKGKKDKDSAVAIESDNPTFEAEATIGEDDS